jgi:molybdopterin synthase catalytic subunit
MRERVGSAQIQVELEEGATITDLHRRLLRDHPGLEDDFGRFPVVLNGEVCEPGTVIPEGAEVAWLPPVAGGSSGEVVEAFLTPEPLDADSLARAVSDPAAGAIAVFLGVVRNHEGERRVERLEYEAYESLAAPRLRAVAEESLSRWPEARIAVAHRVGPMEIGETSVVVAVATPHRAEAFDCCRYLMDRVKVGVPIWKKSYGPDGERWVEGQSYEPGGEGE